MYLSEQAETLIKQDFLKDNRSNGAHTDTRTERSIGAVLEQSQEAGVVAVLQATIDTLQGQLEVKDRQIEQQTQTITRLRSQVPSMKKRLEEAQRQQRLEQENRRLRDENYYLQSELQEERSFTERLTDGIGRMLDFLEEHLPERLRPLLEKARELLPDPEIGQQQEQQQHQRGMGGMEL